MSAARSYTQAERDAMREALRRTPAWRNAVAEHACVEAYWAIAARATGDEAGQRRHESAVIRLANTLIFSAA